MKRRLCTCRFAGGKDTEIVSQTATWEVWMCCPSVCVWIHLSSQMSSTLATTFRDTFCLKATCYLGPLKQLPERKPQGTDWEGLLKARTWFSQGTRQVSRKERPPSKVKAYETTCSQLATSFPSNTIPKKGAPQTISGPKAISGRTCHNNCWNKTRQPMVVEHP